MRIALIATGPNYLRKDDRFPHIGIGYMISCLEEKSHRCFYLDTNFDSLECLDTFMPDMFGISVTSASFNETMKICNIIKQKSTAKIVLGGPHVNVALGDVLNEPFVDYAIYGEGEITLTEFVTALEGNSTESLSTIRGLIFRQNGKIVTNPPRPWIDRLDSLPYPAYHHFQKYPYGRHPLLTTRGCPHRCVYCTINKTWGRKVRSRAAENIVEEIEYVLHNWGEKPFIILDDTFNINIRRCKEFCRILIRKELNIHWSCWSFRADNVDKELAELMKKSGCTYVSVGIESSVPEVLQQIKKGETIEDITRGIKFLQDAGIIVHGNFMIGNPGDTLETVEASVKYVKKLKLNDFDFYLALPYPGTELWNYAENEGRFFNKDYTKYNHFSDVPVFETDSFSLEERKRAFLITKRAKLLNKIRRKLGEKYTIFDIMRVTRRFIRHLFASMRS